MQRQPLPCKWGAKCHKFPLGQCRFSHNDQQHQQGNQNVNNPSSFGSNPRPRPNFAQQGYGTNPTNQSYGQGGQSYGQSGQGGQGGQGSYRQGDQGVQGSYGQGGMGGKGGWGSQHGNYGKQQYDQGSRPPYQNPQGKQGPNIPKQDQFDRGFCRDFQFNQVCKFQQTGKCTRRHGFDLQQKIHRVNYTNLIPTHDKSKIGKFQKDGESYFILRMGNQVTLMKLNQTKDDFVLVNKWAFPNQQLNYDFYSQRQNFIYIAAQNPKKFIYNIWIYDILTGNIITLQQAHEKTVTGVIHFNDQIVLTCAKDGLINVWKIEGNKGIIDKVTSNNLLKAYAIENSKIEINFLDITKMGESPLVAAGTTDGRVLFFYGDQLSYSFIYLGENYAKVFDIKYTIMNGIQIGLVLTWSLDNNTTSIVAINFSTSAPSLFLTFNAQEQPNNKINLIQIFQDKLFVANLYGTITIYNLVNAEKVGLIMCKNRINSILPASYLTQTQIKRNLFLILESKLGQRPGSLAIYLMKQ